MSTWFDNTGVLRKYGPAQADPVIGGEYKTFGALNEVEFTIDLTKLTEDASIQSDVVFLPKNIRIEEIEVVAHTAAEDGAAFDLGLVRTDRSTEVDFDGLLAALPIDLVEVAGTKTSVTAGHDNAGALIGATTSYPSYVTANRTTSAAFTAGVVRVRIKYYA